MKLKIKNGFSLVEVLIVTALIGVISAGVMTVAQEFVKMQSQNNQRMMAVEIRNELRKTISDQGAWMRTMSDVALNPDATAHFDCFRNLTDCTPVSSTVAVYDFVPKTISDTLYQNAYNPVANPTQGFTTDGTVCNTFVAPPGAANSNCVFRYTFKWAPDCTGLAAGSCISPKVLVAVSFVHNPMPGIIPLSGSAANLNAISQAFVRGKEYDTLTLQAICAAYGPGTSYDAVTGKCVQATLFVPIPYPVASPVYVPVPTPCTSSGCSDIRVKKDVHSFELGLSEALKIKPVTFKYNGLAGSQNDNFNYSGVIAQDLEKVAPVMVHEKMGSLSPGDGNQALVKTVDYNGISMMLVNAVQELNQRLERLETENANLKKENKKLIKGF